MRMSRLRWCCHCAKRCERKELNSEGVKWVALHSACSEGVGIHTDAQARMHEHWQQPMCRCHSCGVQSPCCCCCCCCWEEEDDEEEEGVGAAGGFCFFTALAVCGRRRVQAEVRVCVVCVVLCVGMKQKRKGNCTAHLCWKRRRRGVGAHQLQQTTARQGGRGRRRVCVHVWCDYM